MADLITTPNLRNTDDFYAALLAAHEGCDEAATHRLNARLILILANHVGDLDVLQQALTLARGSAPAGDNDPTKA
jgi:hypothetical protein